MPTGKLGVFRGTLLFGRNTLINILPFFRGTFLFGGTLLFGRREYLKETNTTFMDAFRDLGLKQIITSPTRYKFNIFDLAEKCMKTKFNADGTDLDLFLTISENG